MYAVACIMTLSVGSKTQILSAFLGSLVSNSNPHRIALVAVAVVDVVVKCETVFEKLCEGVCVSIVRRSHFMGCVVKQNKSRRRRRTEKKKIVHEERRCGCRIVNGEWERKSEEK